jgi:hydrogenase nickel incorporation protein HypB
VAKNISIDQHIMSANDQLAARVRARLEDAGVYAINIMASPGAGKTSLILRTVEVLKQECRIAAVDGDVAAIDVERIGAAGIPVKLINTGGSCHLDANMLLAALPDVPLDRVDLLIVENVGNLICPANFALGVHANVVVSSVPEGDDKPYKYPAMFRGADVLLLNKIDMLAYEAFDVDYFRRGVEALNPNLAFFPLSCKTGEGIAKWLAWLRARISQSTSEARQRQTDAE